MWPVRRWTAAELEQARGWVMAGWSAVEIGRRLGRTRNSVLGQLNRADIHMGRRTGDPVWNQAKIKNLRRMERAGYTPERIAADTQMPIDKVRAKILSVQRQRADVRMRRQVASMRPTAREIRAGRIAAAKDEAPIGVTFADIDFERQCKFIVGDINGLNTLYCGVGVISEAPYCAAHCRLCYSIAA